ncbi:MAG TPA: hypothetical protein VFM70_04360 [Salinimicrobium sp.]|nr:hypothetical protein [Salinimicrobium sp.]
MQSVDTTEFTSKQKVIFLTASVKNLIASVRGKNKQLLEMQNKNEELANQILELQKTVNAKNQKIQNQKRRIKILEQY